MWRIAFNTPFITSTFKLALSWRIVPCSIPCLQTFSWAAQLIFILVVLNLVSLDLSPNSLIFAMSLSWDDLSAGHKIVFLLESLANEQHQLSPISCRVCEKVFFDSTSLLDHFLSHFSQDGTVKGKQHVESSVRNSVSEVNSETSAQGSVSPTMSDLSLGHWTSAAKPQHSSNSNASSSHPSGLQHSRLLTRSTGPDVSTSETSTQSSFTFPSDPGTSSVNWGTTRCHPQTARKKVVESPFSDYTRPYIKLLERPIQETIVILEDVGGNNNRDEIDLTLKL